MRFKDIFKLPKCMVHHIKLPYKLSNIMLKYGIFAIPMPWGTIFYSDIAYKSQAIRRHELVHVAQMRKYGALYWLVSYFYYLYKVGYYNNPYEIEARRLSNTNVVHSYLNPTHIAVLVKLHNHPLYKLSDIEKEILLQAHKYYQDEIKEVVIKHA